MTTHLQERLDAGLKMLRCAMINLEQLSTPLLKLTPMYKVVKLQLTQAEAALIGKEPGEVREFLPGERELFPKDVDPKPTTE